ncbi:MAG: hypothetical protein ACSHWU_05340 [Marinicella sp.]
MKTLKSKLKNSFKIGACISIYHITASPAWANNPTPILDGYAYQLFNDIEIDIENQVIIVNSDMRNCEQPNGEAPLDTEPFALRSSNNQFIGLSHFAYNITHNNIYFTSETNNLLCDNGVYVDTLFYGSFE